ncbi:D-alanyl-D-alanine carboxypeptidase family protein [Phycicoccus ginsengisoli]
MGFGRRAGLAAAALAAVTLAGAAPALASSSTPSVTSTTPAPRSPGTGPATGGPGASPTGVGTATDPATGGTGEVTGRATATPGAAGERTLSPADLAAQIAKADALTADLARSNAGIAAAAEKLSRLAVQANALLQQYSEASTQERAARDEAVRDVAVYQRLSSQMGQDRRALAQWAYLAYAGTGGTITDVGALLDTLAKPPAEASDSAAQLSYLSDLRAGAFERVQNQTELQRSVAVRAVEASTRATEAAAAAKAAKDELDVVIAEQKSQLETTRSLHAAQVQKAGPVAGLLLGSEDAAALEASKRLRKALVIPGVSADGSVKPCSTNENDYPNGQIPAAGLCPLVGDPSQSLRPGAAAAFNAMSLAYQKDSGKPLCITDSYRSYAEQVSVKASRGKWAAEPGRSEHGLGRAVDLCGGVEDFGNPAHLWMTQNAPLYGWFHPDWAEPQGSLPEPWHWEFAG